MSVLTIPQLAAAISDMDCGDCEDVNNRTLTELGAGKGIFVTPIDGGGDGVSAGTATDIYDTLIQISETEAAAANTAITTDYQIMSDNGYPT